MDDKLGGFSVQGKFIVLGNKLARTVSLFLEGWVIIVPGFFEVGFL